MTIPHLTQTEFIDFLKANGCEIVCDDNWEDFKRIILKKGNETFPLQMTKVYYYYLVNKICDDLGIEPPEDCAKMRGQIRGRNKDKDMDEQSD